MTDAPRDTAEPFTLDYGELDQLIARCPDPQAPLEIAGRGGIEGSLCEWVRDAASAIKTPCGVQLTLLLEATEPMEMRVLLAQDDLPRIASGAMSGRALLPCDDRSPAALVQAIERVLTRAAKLAPSLDLLACNRTRLTD